ncbi:11899_t:CDS:1, partial [Gigaspora rosea]
DDNYTNDIFSNVSSLTMHSTSKKLEKKLPYSLSNVIVKNITAKERPKFEQLLLQMTISNGWAFQWTANPATQEFFEFLNPLLTLFSHHALSNHILGNKKNVVIMSCDQKLKNSTGVILAFDGWKNILKQHIFGSLFILSIREVQIWEATNISLEREQMINIIPKIEKMIEDASNIRANY